MDKSHYTPYDSAGNKYGELKPIDPIKVNEASDKYRDALVDNQFRQVSNMVSTDLDGQINEIVHELRRSVQRDPVSTVSTEAAIAKLKALITQREFDLLTKAKTLIRKKRNQIKPELGSDHQVKAAMGGKRRGLIAASDILDSCLAKLKENGESK